MTAVLEGTRVRATSPQDERIVDAALRCVARWGVAKTTLDDIAREAGCSRATVYRLFPGGKDALFEVVTRTEVARAFAAVGARFGAARTIEDLLVAGMTEAARRVRDHAALQFVLAHEPEVILPRMAFRHLDSLLRAISAFAAPYIVPFVGGDTDHATRIGEWVTRIVLSYTSCPADDVDMTDEESVRRLVRAFVLPGLSDTP